MIGSGVRGWLGAALLCAACGSSGSNLSAAGGGSNMDTHMSAAGADTGPRQGQSCTCVQAHSGAFDCSEPGVCACLCNNVACSTDGGLPSTEQCKDDACTACDPEPAEPNSSTLVLQQEAYAVAMAPDDTTYVLFGGFPYLGHYTQGGAVISVDTDVPIDAADWANTTQLLVAPDGTLYSAVRVRSLTTVEHDTSRILHSDSNGLTLASTSAPADVVGVIALSVAPGGKLYALATTANSTTIVAELASDGTFGTRTQVPADFGFDVSNFATNDNGDFVFTGYSSVFSPYASRIALLAAGASTLSDLYDASHDLVGNVAADPAGGWWFSSGTLTKSAWVATLYHTGSGMDLSTLGEVSSPIVADTSKTVFGSQFALLSDSALLLNVNSQEHQPQSIGRFANGKLIQPVDVTDAYLLATSGNLAATALTGVGFLLVPNPGFDQVRFEARH